MRYPDESIDDYVERRVTEALGRVEIASLQQLPLAAMRRYFERSMSTEVVDSDNVTEAVVHIGEVRMTARSTAPQGWLMCDGSVLSRTQYAVLFAAIGTEFNIGGEAATEFRLPDLRGRAPVGVDGSAARLSANDTLGDVGGTETHSLSIAEIPAHDHGGSTGTGATGSSLGSHNHDPFIGAGNNAPSANFGLLYQQTTAQVNITGFHASVNLAHTHSVPALSISSQGGGGAHNNLQPYQIVNFIIKY